MNNTTDMRELDEGAIDTLIYWERQKDDMAKRCYAINMDVHREKCKNYSPHENGCCSTPCSNRNCLLRNVDQ